MFKNFITLAYRHFIRSPLTSFIEVFGLTSALTMSILILLWVHNELKVDKFNEHYDNIYRLEVSGPNLPSRSTTSLAQVPFIISEVKEVESVSSHFYVPSEEFVINDHDQIQHRYDIEVIYAEKEMFNTFSLDFIAGNPETALNQKYTIVLTESLANAMFSGQEALGKVLIDNKRKPVIVTGVIKDVPDFHLSFQALRSLVTREDYTSIHDWVRTIFTNYIRLSPGAEIRKVENSIASLYKVHMPEAVRNKWPNQHVNLRPLSDIYFNGGMVQESGSSRHGDLMKIAAYASVAIFALLLAAVNFINMSSAKSLGRMKEIAIKKVSGASRWSVLTQLFGEVAIQCFMALIISIVFAHSLIPRFNLLMDSSIDINQLLELKPSLYVISGILLLTVIAGGIPAFSITSIKTISAVSGSRTVVRKSPIKKASLLVQFSITILLLVGLATIFRQIHYMKNADMGYETDQLVYFDFDSRLHSGKGEFLKSELSKNPNIDVVSQTQMGIPGSGSLVIRPWTTVVFGDSDNKLKWAIVDDNYLEVLELKPVMGRFFESKRPNDFQVWDSSENIQIVINERAMKLLDLGNPLGKRGKWLAQEKEIEIIGVIPDFHFDAVSNEIPPVFLLWTERPTQMIARISAHELTSTLRFIEREVEKITDRTPDIEFVEDNFAKQYSKDESFAELLSYLTVLIIIIGSMGLIGVFMHAIKVRIQEIGVRKVLGASLSQIIKLLSGPIITTIVVASFIAIPIGAIVMNDWLANYPYRIEMDWTIYAVAIGSTLLIAALTIGWQCWQASNQNPAKLIRYE